MQVSYNWLKEYVDIEVSPEKLAEILTKSGVAVEHVIPCNKGVSGVYAAKCRFRRSMPILRSPKSFCKPAKEIPMRGFLRPRRCVRL